MPTAYQFEPEARVEYRDAIHYYAVEVEGADVAARFVDAVDSAVTAICVAPERWRVVAPMNPRRYVLRRFPFVLYYHHDTTKDLVIIYTVMHTSRQPDYWHERLPPFS